MGQVSDCINSYGEGKTQEPSWRGKFEVGERAQEGIKANPKKKARNYSEATGTEGQRGLT